MYKYVIITPARNEQQHIAQTILSVAKQTCLPKTWIIVDDNSTDSTPKIIDDFAGQLNFIRPLMRNSSTTESKIRDGLATASEAKAFNFGLRTIDLNNFDFIVKLDADLAFDPDYFETLLSEFQNDPSLGIAGGHCYELRNGERVLEWVPCTHVRGATKMYRRECFEAIGGIKEILGWDTIDELQAQKMGWTTKSLASPGVLHLRPTGTANGLIRGKTRAGEASYILGYHPLYALARGIRFMLTKPYLIAGLAYMWGFIKGYVVRPCRAEDRALIAFLRKQQLSTLFSRQLYRYSIGRRLHEQSRARIL